MNTEGMLPFEQEVADYVKSTGNHVLYEVTPIFADDDLVARGVHMQAESIEDEGAGVQFNVFVFNVQPAKAAPSRQKRNRNSHRRKERSAATAVRRSIIVRDRRLMRIWPIRTI